MIFLPNDNYQSYSNALFHIFIFNLHYFALQATLPDDSLWKACYISCQVSDNKSQIYCHKLSGSMTKPTKWHVRPVKTQISPSDQSLRCLHEETLGPWLSLECTAKTLIRLSGCPGWSESSLSAQAILFILSCCGSIFDVIQSEIVLN